MTNRLILHVGHGIIEWFHRKVMGTQDDKSGITNSLTYQSLSFPFKGVGRGYPK